MRWFKFYGQDFLADMKMSQLSIAERLTWVTLLCLAHEEDRGGNIRYCTEELVKSKMGLQEDDSEWGDLKGVFDLFESLEMLKKTDNGVFLINFQKRQEINLTPAEKMQRYRAKKDSNKSYQNSVTSVTPNRIEENRIDLNASRSEIHIEVENKKEKKVTKEMQEVFDLFKGNPARFVWGMRVLERKAADVLFKEFGISELRNRYQISLMYKDEQHCPQVNSPSDFLEKMPKMEKFLNDKKK